MKRPRRSLKMIMLASWCAAGLLTSSAHAQEGRLGDNIHPVEQDVKLRVDPAQESFTGSTEIAIKVDKATDVLRFHALDITIDQAVLAAGEKSWPLSVREEGNGIVALSPGLQLPAGSYRLLLDFSGPFNKQSAGLYKFTDQGAPYLSTQFEMTDARRCFPCFDEPIFKIPFQLTIEAPKNLRVYNNAPEINTTTKGSWATHEFAQTLPIPSYLVALAVGPYEQVDVAGLSVPGHIVTPKGKLPLSKYAQTVSPAILGALEAYFGIDYPYKKLDQVAITEFPYGAMENAGMVTYREDVLLVNEATATEETRTETSMVIAHELSHQWFGNLVTMKWWSDLWLNEAFATWMAAKVVVRLYPELEYDLYTPQNSVMTADANLTTKPIRKPIKSETDILDGLGLAYNKGGAVLNMVERWLGEKTFQTGIRAYMQEHKFGNADAADLWSALGKASDKDVEAVLKSFTEQSGYPMVTVEREGKTLTLSQRRFANAGVQAPPQSWTLPLFIRYGSGSKQAVATVVLEGEQTSIDLDFEPEWIFPDDGAVGYFRWTLSKPDLTALVAHRAELSDREQIALVYNIDGLFKAGALSAGEELAYMAGFLRAKHPSVVALALAFLDSKQRLFVDDQNREAWRLYLEKALEPVARRFDLTPRPGESAKAAEMRPIVLRLLARDIGDPELLATADREARAYISETSTVDPTLADVYLEIAARHGGVAMVDEVKNAMVASKDPQRRTTLLRTLGMFEVAEAQNKALDLMLDPVVTASDLRILLSENSYEEARRRRLQAWLEKNYGALAAKLPPAFLGKIPASVGGARDLEQLQIVLDFYGKQADPSGALGREVAKLTESVRTAVATREREQASFDAFLEKKTP